MSYQVSNYEEAIQFLFGRINYERASAGSYTSNDLKLNRMETLLERLGNPQQRIPAIHLAGTKGKGSTATMIAHTLTAAGYQTGLFTSPHLHRFEERFVVNGKLPTEEQFVSLVQQLLPHLAAMDEQPGQMAPTYFEIATALAWMHFEASQIDFVVLETGLGGRLDTTRLCDPLVTVITCISLDHTHLLGETVAEIAAEKAGILKRGVPLVSGVRDPAAREVIHSIAEAQEVPLVELGTDFHIDSAEIQFDRTTGFRGQMTLRKIDGETVILRPGLPGKHQAENAALACTVCNLLNEQGIRIEPEHIEAGVSQVRCPLRIELVQSEPIVILDAAHNIASITALVETLKLVPAEKRTVIFASSRDKKTAEMLTELRTGFDRIILTTFQSNPRAVPLEELVSLAETTGFVEIGLAETPTAAWEMASANASPSDLICVSGSFFLATEVREHLQSLSTPTDLNVAQPVPDLNQT
ncbi:MAG: bifunctional folylpolyglutamate synthase/dihydrofolate synthase [Planctomycetaceae bacterium]|nr:bifunctional folylpolyglutamate synthase/dihydrofolate synthase [Planctomycetaceae bacterium]